MTSEWALRESIVEIGKRLYAAGYIRGVDGNMSIRLSHNEVLITPSRSAKGFLDPRDLLVINMEGEPVNGAKQPSLETHFHLGIYKERQDVSAVVHAHPPKTIAHTVAGRTIPHNVLPELTLLFPGGIPVLPYETPATAKLGELVRTGIKNCDLLILAHHGTVSVGRDIYEAWSKVEHVEACVEILMLAKILGKTNTIPDDKILELEQVRELVAAATIRNQ